MADYEREKVVALKAIAKELEEIRREITKLRRDLQAPNNIEIVADMGVTSAVIPLTDEIKATIEKASQQGGI